MNSLKTSAAPRHIPTAHADVNWVQFEDAPSAVVSSMPDDLSFSTVSTGRFRCDIPNQSASPRSLND